MTRCHCKYFLSSTAALCSGPLPEIPGINLETGTAVSLLAEVGRSLLLLPPSHWLGPRMSKRAFPEKQLGEGSTALAVCPPLVHVRSQK